MFNLGIIYATGLGTDQDNDEAVYFYRSAATLGYAPAQANLAVMYVNGQGVAESSLFTAYMWAWLAAEQGNAQADIYVQALEQELSEEEIVNAQASAQACVSSNYNDC